MEIHFLQIVECNFEDNFSCRKLRWVTFFFHYLKSRHGIEVFYTIKKCDRLSMKKLINPYHCLLSPQKASSQNQALFDMISIMSKRVDFDILSGGKNDGGNAINFNLLISLYSL